MHVLSVLVENKPGVLARIAALFSRRGFNIHSLAVGPTEHEEISRMTVLVDAEELPLEQVTKQLNKLIEVLKVVELDPDNTVARRILLVKVKTDAATLSAFRHPVACKNGIRGPQTRQQRDDQALSRFTTQMQTSMSIGSLIGLAIGRAVVIAELVAAEIPPAVAALVFEQVLGRVYATAISILVIAGIVAVGAWLFKRFAVMNKLREWCATV